MKASWRKLAFFGVDDGMHAPAVELDTGYWLPDQLLCGLPWEAFHHSISATLLAANAVRESPRVNRRGRDTANRDERADLLPPDKTEASCSNDSKLCTGRKSSTKGKAARIPCVKGSYSSLPSNGLSQISWRQLSDKRSISRRRRGISPRSQPSLMIMTTAPRLKTRRPQR